MATFDVRVRTVAKRVENLAATTSALNHLTEEANRWLRDPRTVAAALSDAQKIGTIDTARYLALVAALAPIWALLPKTGVEFQAVEPTAQELAEFAAEDAGAP